MREFGFLWPIMVNGKTRRIVAGNGRYLAALRLGLPVVPMVEERHLTPLQRRAFIIADNKIALTPAGRTTFWPRSYRRLGTPGSISGSPDSATRSWRRTSPASAS